MLLAFFSTRACYWHIQLVVCQDFLVFFCKGALYMTRTLPVLLLWTIPSQQKDFAFTFAEHPEVHLSPHLQPFKHPLNGSLDLQLIECSSPIWFNPKHWWGALFHTAQVINTSSSSGFCIDPWGTSLTISSLLDIILVITTLWPCNIRYYGLLIFQKNLALASSTEVSEHKAIYPARSSNRFVSYDLVDYTMDFNLWNCMFSNP